MDTGSVYCQPQTRVWEWGLITFTGLVAGLFLTGVAVVVLDAAEVRYDPTTVQMLLSVAVVAITGSLCFIQYRYLGRNTCLLTTEALEFGPDDSVRIPLDDISKIIVGIDPDPERPCQPLVRFMKWHWAWRELLNRRARSLFVRLKDDRYLVLHLLEFPGGIDLMNALLERLADRVDRERRFTGEEADAARRFWRAWNRVLSLGPENRSDS